MQQKQRIVVAIGGNSLIRDKEHKSVPDQYQAVLQTVKHLGQLVEQGHRLVVTHGNGPQVGFILRRAELAAQELHRVPLDSCGADTQGAIGYQIQQAFHQVGAAWPQPPKVATIVTQVRVDPDDPAFAKPSKPIGSFMQADEARRRQRDDNWQVKEDAGRGYRRVVASPKPQQIIELDAIKALYDQGFVVVAVGGGGIPVARNKQGLLRGVEAVIDKDYATALLATQLQADVLIISTAVEQVFLDFGKKTQRPLARMSVSQARQYAADGQFAPGSMLPKIEAMLEFVEATGHKALLSDPAHISAALDGKTGTWIEA